jgi:uncharacterized cofD-like protein
MKDANFELLGHDCPTGIYPAPVVPVGVVDQQLAAVYLDLDVPRLHFLEDDTEFSRHRFLGDGTNERTISDAFDWIDSGMPDSIESLHDFDFHTERLFAFTQDIVLAYPATKEATFFQYLLSKVDFSTDNRFLRLALAKEVNDGSLLLTEMRACLEQLLKDAPDLVDTWYAGQIEQLASSANFGSLELPGSWSRLLTLTELRRTPSTVDIVRPRFGGEIKVAVIGGGSGTSAVLRGLKHWTTQVSAVVTMFDSGGSSGLLQQEFGYPPLGDLRQCLLGLCEDTEANRSLRELLDFRFNLESSLKGHNLGNPLLAALATLGKDLELAVDEMARLLRITGQVLPVSLDRADLCAQLEDGELLRGQSTIDLRGQREPRINKVFLDPGVSANPKAIRAILEADVVVLGPGDLYTSIIPNLLVDGIPDALAATQATRVDVCNLMTKLGETDDFQASNFVGEMIHYLGSPCLDWVMVNSGTMLQEVKEAYLYEGASPVVVDLEKVRSHVPGVFATHLGNNQVPLKHDSQRVAELVMRIADMGRVGSSQPTQGVESIRSGGRMPNFLGS